MRAPKELRVATLFLAVHLSSNTLRRVRARKGSHLVYVNRDALADLLDAVEATNPGCLDEIAKVVREHEKERREAKKAAKEARR